MSGTRIRLMANVCIDSVAWGYGSSDWNGYRQWLLQELVGNNVDYIGSGVTGLMDKNANEGRPGERINQTMRFSSPALHQRPNVILLNVGNNDCVYQDDVDHAPTRLEKLLEDIFTICPDTTLILSTLGPSSNDYYMQRFAIINNAMPAMVESFIERGKHILIANMSSIEVQTDMFDDLHMNDLGYYEMAKAFYSAMYQANLRGWINSPVPVSQKALVLETACNSLPTWEQLPILFAGFRNAPPDALYFFGDVDGDSRDDLIVLAPDGTIQPYINLLNPLPDPNKIIEWWPAETMSSPASTAWGAPKLLLADLTGATFSSLIYVYPNGSIFAAQNLGPDPSLGVIVFKDLALVADGEKLSIPTDPKGIRFHDIDGDGRADLLYLSQDGALSAWLNRADLQKHSTGTPDPNALNIDWIPQGEIISSRGTVRKDVRLADLNGDGMADYMIVNEENGSVVTWLNKGYAGSHKKEPETSESTSKQSWAERTLIDLIRRPKKKATDSVEDLNGGDRYRTAIERDRNKMLMNQKEGSKTGDTQSLLTEKPQWKWENLGTVFDGTGRKDEGTRFGPGTPGVTFADVVSETRLYQVIVSKFANSFRLAREELRISSWKTMGPFQAGEICAEIYLSGLPI